MLIKKIEILIPILAPIYLLQMYIGALRNIVNEAMVCFQAQVHVS